MHWAACPEETSESLHVVLHNGLTTHGQPLLPRSSPIAWPTTTIHLNNLGHAYLSAYHQATPTTWTSKRDMSHNVTHHIHAWLFQANILFNQPRFTLGSHGRTDAVAGLNARRIARVLQPFGRGPGKGVE